MAADGRDLRIGCIALKRSAFAPIRTTLIGGPHARSAQETPAMAWQTSYEAPGTLKEPSTLQWQGAARCSIIRPVEFLVPLIFK